MQKTKTLTPTSHLELDSKEDYEMLSYLSERISLLRNIKHAIKMTTEESYLLDFSEFKLVAPPKRELTVVLEDKYLKDVISYLEIDDTINLRRVNRKLK